MVYLKLFESFDIVEQTINDILVELDDIVKPSIVFSWSDNIDADFIYDDKPNLPELFKITEYKYSPEHLNIDEWIELLKEAKQICARIGGLCEREGVKFEWSIKTGSLVLCFIEKIINENYISYKDRFKKLINVNSYYYVTRGGDNTNIGKFEPSEHRDNITHCPPSGNYFNTSEFKAALSGSDSLRRKIYKIGEEGKMLGKKKIDMDDLLSIRKNIKKTYEGYYSSRTTPKMAVDDFDREIKKVYSFYKVPDSKGK